MRSRRLPHLQEDDPWPTQQTVIILGTPGQSRNSPGGEASSELALPPRPKHCAPSPSTTRRPRGGLSRRPGSIPDRARADRRAR